MKILFINPPRSYKNALFDHSPEDAKKFIHKKLIGPPLGLLTIATSIRDIADIAFVDLKGEYDLNPGAPDLKTITEKYVKEHNPDIVAVTFIASELYFGLTIFKTVKSINSEILTVAGGLHATVCADDFNDPSVDIICPGQSAGSFRELVASFIRRMPFENVSGIIINKDQKLIKTKQPDYKFDPVGDDFIMPDRSLLKRWISTYKVGKSPHPTTYIYTSLGCPYKCTFCSIWGQFDGGYYQRRIESIIDELKSVDDYYVVRFSDANTIVNIDFINKLFDRIKEERIDKFFIMDIRFDTAVKHPELIKKLSQCGLKVVICGFESFKEEDLKKYNKSASAKLIEEAIKVFHDNGIMLRGNYVVPHDYSLDDFKALEDYASGHKVVYAGYSLLTPMPGTPLYEEMKSKIIDFDLEKYNFFNCVLKTKLPIEKFYERAARLWLIKEGEDVI